MVDWLNLLNYFKARAFWNLRNTRQAERYYRESLSEDPVNFWSIADLALLYASGKEDSSQRRSRAEPYIKKLRTLYVDNPLTKSYLIKIETALESYHGNLPVDEGPAAGSK